MSSRLEDLRDLAQLLDEGKISQREFEVVKTELLEAPAEEWAANHRPVDDELEIPASNGGRKPAHVRDVNDAESDHGDDPTEEPEWLVFVREIPLLYWVSIGLMILTLFYGGRFEPIAWATGVTAAIALLRQRTANGRWMAWTGLAVGLSFSIIGLFTSGGTTVDAAPQPAASGPAQLAEIPVGSLGVRLEDLEEGWNALDDPPFILRGISTTPEAGPLDSFLYRFDGGAVLAGAFHPGDGFIYALMARAGLGHEAASSMYVHLCYLLYPGTQECFDAYVDESGVFGRTVEELSASDHEAGWFFEGNEWRVEIVDSVQTIRVLGPVETG